MPFWLTSNALPWVNSERASSEHISSTQVCARRRPRRRGITLILPGPLANTPCVESLVAHLVKGTIDSISEETLGIDRKLPEATRSIRCGEPSSRPCQISLGQRSWQAATAIE